LRLAEALRDASDRAAVGAAVEKVGGLEQGDLSVGEPAQNRLLLRKGVPVRGAGEAEKVDEVALAAATAASLERRRRRRTFLDPAGLDRELLAERTDVDELGSLTGGETHRTLAHQERPLAHGTRPRCRDLRDPHLGVDFSQAC
jgi:hypothetical protein